MHKWSTCGFSYRTEMSRYREPTHTHSTSTYHSFDSHFVLHLAIFSHKLKWQHVLQNTRSRVSIKCWFVTKCSCRQRRGASFDEKKKSSVSHQMIFALIYLQGNVVSTMFYFGVWIHGICRNGSVYREHNLLSRKQINTVLLCLV